MERVFWQDLWPYGRPTLEQATLEGLHSMGWTHTGTVWKELQPVEGLMLEKFLQDCLPWEGSHTGAGEREERNNETMVMN